MKIFESFWFWVFVAALIMLGMTLALHLSPLGSFFTGIITGAACQVIRNAICVWRTP